MQQAHVNSEAQDIIVALYNKSKRDFKYYNSRLVKQALSFTPAYRDFVLKIIKNGSLKIKHKYKEGSIMSNDEREIPNKLNKRAKSIVYTDINDVDTLPHELGHAVDFWFGHNKALSSNVIIKDNKTLYEIFMEEFESNHEEIYRMVMEEYKDIINSNINDNAFDILSKGYHRYRILLASVMGKPGSQAEKNRKAIQKELYESGFVETYYLFVSKKCYSILNAKYSPVLDALSSRYDFSGMWLDHHDRLYYRLDRYRAVQEFFANLFAAKITSKHQHFDNLIKLLPNSFDAFERLFVMFYDHIQNNKRFTDVILKERK